MHQKVETDDVVMARLSKRPQPRDKFSESQVSLFRRVMSDFSGRVRFACVMLSTPSSNHEIIRLGGLPSRSYDFSRRSPRFIENGIGVVM